MGAMRGALLRGWQQIACEDLGVHRITLNRVLKNLESKGFVRQVRRGTFSLVQETFISHSDQSRVKIIKETDDANA